MSRWDHLIGQLKRQRRENLAVIDRVGAVVLKGNLELVSADDEDGFYRNGVIGQVLGAGWRSETERRRVQASGDCQNLQREDEANAFHVSNQPFHGRARE